MKKTIRDIDWSGKTAVVRCDFNVPLKDGKITDDTRIVASLPTIEYLNANGARVVLMSHLGRPKGQPKEEYSLAPVAARLSECLGKEVKFLKSDAVVDDSVREAVASLDQHDIALLENVRFRKEETDNDAGFAKDLAGLGDVFVQDAFGTSHRAHASTTGIAYHIPAVSGFLIEKELKFLGEAVESPERPLAAIMGGAKVADKIPVIVNLLDKVDILIIGGGMAYTFLKAEGYDIGTSIFDEEGFKLVPDILAKAEAKGVKFLLPKDVVCSDEFAEDSPYGIYDIDSIPADRMGMDIGPKTIKEYTYELTKAKTIIWNGPMGVFEFPRFAAGTNAIAECLADSPATTIIGGGDSAAAVQQAGLGSEMTHISTGGGASLEFLEGKQLPGIACLDEAKKFLIAGNWKMNKTTKEALEFADEIKSYNLPNAGDVAVIAPFTQLAALKAAFAGTGFKVGAQNVHFEKSGAYTGEISVPMLSEIGVDYCVIGHSERREYFAETDATVNLKLKALFAAGITPILCVGESLEVREAGNAMAFVGGQLFADLDGLTPDQVESMVIAYEPIWAIGTGRTATPDQAEEMCAFIRGAVEGMFGEVAASRILIQYGGSMKPSNARDLLSKADINGGLIGGASLEAAGLADIARTAYEQR